MGLRIKTLRLAAGLTQGQLAERAGLERSQLSKIEIEREPANTRRLSAIAKSLGVQVNDLFEGTSPDSRDDLLSVFALLSESDRAAILAHARALAAARKPEGTD